MNGSARCGGLVRRCTGQPLLLPDTERRDRIAERHRIQAVVHNQRPIQPPESVIQALAPHVFSTVVGRLSSTSKSFFAATPTRAREMNFLENTHREPRRRRSPQDYARLVPSFAGGLRVITGPATMRAVDGHHMA